MTPGERAEKVALTYICPNSMKPVTPYEVHAVASLVTLLAAELQEAVEEAHKEWMQRSVYEFCTPYARKARAEALEEAATIAESDECLPGCDSTAHEDLCPVVFPHNAIRARAREVGK